jgi:YD repeat-containing protein
MKYLAAALIIALAVFFIIAIGVFTMAHSAERTTYDASGRLVERAYTLHGQTTTYDASGRLTTRSYTTPHGETTTYDASGRLIERSTKRK